MPDDPTTDNDENEPVPAGEEPEPPPAGEGPEPAPAGEEPEPAPEGEEPPPAASSADSDEGKDDDDSSSKKRKKNGSSDSDSSDSDSSSSDNDAVPQYTMDDVQGALTAAFRNRGVNVGSGDISVYMSGSNMKVSVRLSADALTLPQVPQSTPEPVTPAAGMVLGQVQLLKGASKVGLHIVIVETSEIVQAGEGTASGDSIDTVQAAAEDALAALTILNTV